MDTPHTRHDDANGKGKGNNVCDIIDIRRSEIQLDILGDIRKQLRPDAAGAEKKLPTMLLYDEAGLRIFEEITYLDEYYLTNAEIEILTKWAGHIAERVPDGARVVELGSG
jgi:uncharacterized SAM-dependent methyltransferase